MATFQILSDIHIEYFKEDDIDIKNFIIPYAPYLILAGDIGRGHRYNQLQNFLKKLSIHFKYIFYVLGNQEFYTVKNIKNRNMNIILNDIKNIQKNINNLFILNRNSFLIGDICITGCTLWSQLQMNVPFYVKIPNINKNKYNNMFKKDLNYIKSMIQLCKNQNYKLLVISHHCPILIYSRNNLYDSLYMTDLSYLLKKENIHTWVCGHIHKNFDFYTQGGTRVISNQRGKGENLTKDFSLIKTINI